MKKQTATIKYGLRHIESGRLVTVYTRSNAGHDFCCDQEHILSDLPDKPVWGVDERWHADWVRRHSTEWFNAGYDTPSHRFNPDELEVVKITIIQTVETVDTSDLVSDETIVRERFTTEELQYYLSDAYQTRHKITPERFFRANAGYFDTWRYYEKKRDKRVGEVTNGN